MTTADKQLLQPPPLGLIRMASLFLDLDGTLIEIASRPDGVVVDDHLLDLLARLRRGLAGRLAVVSGRPLAQVRALLRDTDIVVAGSHGAELSHPGHHRTVPEASTLAEHFQQELRQLTVQHPGVLIETKPFGLAIHFRLAPGAGRDCEDLARRIAAAEGYHLQPGKRVFELKFHDLTKGDAVRACMALAPMKDGRPVFIGDDLTDESGFAAAAELGGAGILVGPQRSTEARYGLANVAAALRWLNDAEAVLS